MSRLTRFSILQLPITRRCDHSPMTETVRLVNRSEVIRTIFRDRGNISNDEVHNYLLRSGLRVSDTLINKIRNRLY